MIFSSHRSYELRLFADYFHFYLQDEEADGDLSESWDRHTLTIRVAVVPGTIGVVTARSTEVPVSVSILENAPEVEGLTGWDHVAEASIDVPSGTLIIAGPADYLPDATRIAVVPGAYRARICYGGLDTLREKDLRGDDHYHVLLWPQAYNPISVIKQYQDA
ncbi:MAG TPA: hypothetical protein VFB12_16355 [Ktedonobacteraceae bacterium]|nr:hypothetical protein [Ktedonobacteraceae bacterium]